MDPVFVRKIHGSDFSSGQYKRNNSAILQTENVNKLDYKDSKKFISIKRQEHLSSLVNKSVVWRLEEENITILPMILSNMILFIATSNSGIHQSRVFINEKKNFLFD